MIVGAGFTVARLEAGRYNVVFPPGTFTTFPVMVVVPFGVFGAYGNPVVASAVGFGDGSATFQVTLSSTTPGETLFDNAFMFITVPSLVNN